MSDQLWGTCPWCQRRKRVTKVEEPLLYAHDRPGGNFPCLGSGQDPKEGSVRTADKVSLAIDEWQRDALASTWTNGRSREDIVNELRDLINQGAEPACPRPDPTIVETYTDESLYGDGVDSWQGDASWGWEVAYAFLWLGAIAAGFAAGWWWRGR